MKKLKLILGTSVLAIAGLLTIAADHIDAPAVAGGTSDITDFYAFQGEDTNNVVFVANLQGLMSPSATAGAAFDENVMVEFNIDTTGDNVEDLVIQAIPKNGKMYVYGPYAPNHTGLSSIVDESAALTIVDVTPYTSASPITTTNTSTGLIAFAGPRVVKDTTGKELPEGFQRSEFLLEHGFLDGIYERKNLKEQINLYIDLIQNLPIRK